MAPAYISEIAPARFRGTLTTVQQFAIIFGLFSAFVSNYFLAGVAGESTAEFMLGYEAWRWMFWVELIPATLFLFALMFIPESPRFLVMSGRTERAKKVLSNLYGKQNGAQKFLEIEASLAKDHHQPKLSDVLDKTTRKIRPIVWVGIGIATFQQLVGINVVFYYGAVLWEAAGFSEGDALMINVLSGAVSIAAVFITMFLIDKIGRKPFLLIGSVGMSITLATMVFVFANSAVDAGGNLSLGDQGIVALVAANAYVFFFNLSWGPVMWVMLGEMFPNQIRGSGLAIAGFAQWTANFLITWSFPIMLASINLAGAYGVYTLGAIISIFFIAKFVQETKGKELEEMEG